MKEIRIIVMAVICFVLLITLGKGYVSAAEANNSAEPVYINGQFVGYRDENKNVFNELGQYIVVPNEKNEVVMSAYTRLKNYIETDDVKTIVFWPNVDYYIGGPLNPGSNTTIIATDTKLTFKSETNAIFIRPNKNISNVSIYGGVWRSIDEGGRKGSLFAMGFASNILVDGVDVNANYVGHAIEIIACDNVTIQNSVVNSIGNNPKECHEEAIQIDLATKKTAPKMANFGSEYAKGQTCSNIYILNNTVKGARAVGVNYCDTENGKYLNKFHENIVIKDNDLTGTTSEALAYFNVKGGEISGNKCVTNATRKKYRYAYTIGIHIAIFGKVPKDFKKSTILVENNVVYGKRNAIHVKGYYSASGKIKAKFGTVKIVNNECYCKNGKDDAIVQVKDSCKKFIVKNNKCKKWKK